jgi:hypothetical protein
MWTRFCGTWQRVEARESMHFWFGRMPWAFGWLLLLASAVAAPPSADQIRCLIGQLQSPDFAICAVASRKLVDGGDVAVDALLASAGKADAEGSWRATGVLEQIAQHGNEKTLRRITEGLEALSRSGKPGYDGVVSQLQTRQARLQRERAVMTIRSLGGWFDGDETHVATPGVKSAPRSHGGNPALQPPPEFPAEQAGSAAEPASSGIGFIGDAYVSPEFVNGTESKEPELVLTIDEHWRGGDAGLAALLELGSIVKLQFQQAPLSDVALEQVAALPQLQSVEIEGCHFSAEALDALRQRQPRVQIVVDGK